MIAIQRRGRRVVGWTALALCLAAPLAAQAQEKRCEMKQIGALPVSFENNRPLMAGRINGQPARILADTGAATSLVFRHTVFDMKLPLKDAGGVSLLGVDGHVGAATVAFQSFQLGDYAIGGIEFLVVNRNLDVGDVAMLIGLDIFSRVDVEFDLAHDAIRLFRPLNCGDGPLAYWGPDHGVVPMKRSAYVGERMFVEVMLNGKPMTAMIDSGATTSVITLAAAAEVGVRPDGPNVRKQEEASGGLAGGALPTWVGTFATFQIGDETIRNAKLSMADLFSKNTAVPTGSRVGRQIFENPDMILGADFLRSHRVLISNAQKKVYFSYTGGPVFQITGPIQRPETAAEATVDAKP